MGDNRIDFGKIITNALSVLVATMFVSAVAIMWNGATTVGDKVTASEIKITSAITVLSGEIATNSNDILELREMLAEFGYEVNIPYSNNNGDDEMVEDSTFYPPVNNRKDLKQSNIVEQIEQKYIKSKSIK